MKIGVVGVGYVGLSTAVSLATKFKTVAVDKSRERIKQLEKGAVPIHEKGLGRLLAKGVASKRLAFSQDMGFLAGSDAGGAAL